MSSSSVTSLDRVSRAVSEYGSRQPESSGANLSESMARLHEVIGNMASSLAAVASQQQFMVTQQSSVDSRLMSLDSRQSMMYEQVTGSVDHLAHRLNRMEQSLSPIVVFNDPGCDPPQLQNKCLPRPPLGITNRQSL